MLKDGHGEIPPCPACYQQTFLWFLELCATRQNGMSGPQPITYTEVVNWCMLTERVLERSELNALIALDLEYRLAAANAAETQRRKGKGK